MKITENKIAILTNVIAYEYNSDGEVEEVTVDEEGVAKARKTAITCLERLREQLDTEKTKSNLVAHAVAELELIGEDPTVIDWYTDTIMTFLEFGHSGGSAAVMIPTLFKLLNFEHLNDLTDDPAEWHEVGPKVWQSRRNPHCFSENGGRSYYRMDEEDRRRRPTQRKQPYTQQELVPDSDETIEKDQYEEDRNG